MAKTNKTTTDKQAANNAEGTPTPDTVTGSGSVTPEALTIGKEAKQLAEKLQPYLNAYPDETIFHITTDGQVFLSGNKSDAEAHQKFIDKDGTVTTFNVADPDKF